MARETSGAAATDEADELARLMPRFSAREAATLYDPSLTLVVDPQRARYGTWYELFPRSTSPDPNRHGTFRDVETLLSEISAMGFDILYFPPIHPIGHAFRKGSRIRVSVDTPGGTRALWRFQLKKFPGDVTHAVGTGPGSLLGDLGRRLHLSYLSVTDSWAKGLEFGAGVAALVAIAAFFRRGPTVDAMLAGLVVSFLVNDTPVDVAFLGALGCWTLVRWEAVDSRAMRRRSGPVVLFASSLLLLTLAGCGSEGVVRATPVTVVGTLKQEAPGKGVFLAQGCNACHTYTPAAAKGILGPDLDKLAQYAKQAKQPLAKFARESIVNPGAYIQKPYKNIMPKKYKSLPASDIQALVDFLTKPSG